MYKIVNAKTNMVVQSTHDKEMAERYLFFLDSPEDPHFLRTNKNSESNE